MTCQVELDEAGGIVDATEFAEDARALGRLFPRLEKLTIGEAAF